MNDRMKKHAALYMLINLVDTNSGEINVMTSKLRRVFNDPEDGDTVKVETTEGKIELLYDQPFEVMDAAIKKWQAEH